MTAFEILLNKFYETIEQNEPNKYHDHANNRNSSELYKLIRKFIDTSFFHGNNLSYKNALSEILETSANVLQKTNHEDWSKIKYAFVQNDLHIIRRDRRKVDIANLKMKLDNVF